MDARLQTNIYLLKILRIDQKVINELQRRLIFQTINHGKGILQHLKYFS
jgi:hypothetical protein